VGTGALCAWRFFQSRVKAADDAIREAEERARQAEARTAEATAAQARALHERIDALEHELHRKDSLIAEANEHERACQEALRREIRLSAQRAVTPYNPNEPPPESLPPPPWNENTDVKVIRDEETQRVLQTAKEAYKKRTSSGNIPAVRPKQRSYPGMRTSRMDILIVDDDYSSARSMHGAVEHILHRWGHKDWNVAVVTSAVDGRHLLVADPDMQAAIVDYLMPKFLGDRIIEEALEIRPNLRGRIIVVSGVTEYPSDVAHRLFTELGCLRLDKPFQLEQLEHALRRAISSSKGGGE
jgi:CheY-like chemotaxis protein